MFKFEKAVVGSYFKGNYGPSALGKGAYGDSSDDIEFEDKPTHILGGEFGFILNAGFMGLTLGANVISPENMLGMKGKNSSGDTLARVDSTIIGVLPSVHLEFYPYLHDTYRMVISLGAATGNLTITNRYDLTSDGETAYPGVKDYTEEVMGNAVLFEGFVGFEFNLVDSVTLLADVGYRYFTLSEFKHQRSVTTVDGDVSKGDTAYESDGSTKRKVNLNGAFVGVGLRFFFL